MFSRQLLSPSSIVSPRKAAFTCKITPNTISIVGTGRGKLSVTNDIEAVLRKIEYWFSGVPQKPLREHYKDGSEAKAAFDIRPQSPRKRARALRMYGLPVSVKPTSTPAIIGRAQRTFSIHGDRGDFTVDRWNSTLTFCPRIGFDEVLAVLISPKITTTDPDSLQHALRMY